MDSMTDQPDLQAALIPLAEKAGVDVGEGTDDYAGMLFYVQENDISILFPGADGTLGDAEVTTVLTWLAKAGYEVRIMERKNGDSRVSIYDKDPDIGGHNVAMTLRVAATLNAALVAAVLALHEASK